MYVNSICRFNILVDNDMSCKLLAIYFATSHFRKKKHSLQYVNEEKPTYKRVNIIIYGQIYKMCVLIQIFLAESG